MKNLLLLFILYSSTSMAAPSHYEIKSPFSYLYGKKFILEYIKKDSEVILYIKQHDIDITNQVQVTAKINNLRTGKIQPFQVSKNNDYFILKTTDKSEIYIEVVRKKDKEKFIIDL